jgi:hypothetical protein
MQEKLKGLAQRLDGLATRFQLSGQFVAAEDVRRVATELRAMVTSTETDPSSGRSGQRS